MWFMLSAWNSNRSTGWRRLVSPNRRCLTSRCTRRAPWWDSETLKYHETEAASEGQYPLRLPLQSRDIFTSLTALLPGNDREVCWPAPLGFRHRTSRCPVRLADRPYPTAWRVPFPRVVE